MAFSANLVKLHSLPLWPILGAMAALPLGACIFVHDDDSPPPAADVPTVTDQPMLVSIDPGAALESKPGEGVGIYVEYAAGGKWRIWTSCDANTSKAICIFDLYADVASSATLSDIAGEGIEGADEVALQDGAAYFHAETASDVEAMTFTTTPGAIVRLTAYLDNNAATRFVYWVGNGVLHEGAPTDPVDFQPTSP
jgi:hypothetical protein